MDAVSAADFAAQFAYPTGDVAQGLRTLHLDVFAS
jgi:hypothetical protein